MFSEQIFITRKDLVASRIHQGRDIGWVVKDPLTRKFYYFNEQEYSILTWLDGTRSVRSITSHFCRTFAPVHLTQMQLSHFLSQLAGAELLQGLPHAKPAARKTSLAHRSGAMFGNLLAIRFPGVNPTWLLDRLAPFCNWMFTRTALAAAVILILVAVSCVIVRFDDLVSSLPELQTWGTPKVLLTAAAVVAVSKVLHELAHALTARYYGVRCETMGVLLLIFTPCLYCDVSDAWLLPSRRARMAISAAGILFELVLASLATLLWMVAHDESTRFVLATIMTVCSVATVLCNGNPLMKYDGYFLLSDWLGMPNLATQATDRLTHTAREWIWGEEPAVPCESPPGEQMFLWCYGIAALLYRLILMSAILFGIYKALEAQGFGIFGASLALSSGSLFILRGARKVFRPPRRGEIPAGVHVIRRPAIATACLILCLLGIVLLPIPRRLDAPFRIESRESREIFVPVGGQLLSVAATGTQVQVGDQLAELQKPEIQLELNKLDLQLASLRSRLQSLDSRRSILERADERPTLLESISGIEQKRAVLARELQQLVIRSPLSGIIHQPPNVPDRQHHEKGVSFWSGTPLDPRNLGCYLEPGTQLCSITQDEEKLAVLYISQRRVQKMKPGQSVLLWLPGVKRGRLQAHVIEISPAPIDQIPREMLTKKVIATNPDSPAGTIQPSEPIYRVIARIDSSHEGIPLRATGHASIRVDSVTLWQTMRMVLSEAFDF